MAGDADVGGDWDEYRRLVLDALRRIDHGMRDLDNKMDSHNIARGKEISELQIQVGMLKVQATMWAALASIIVSAVVAVVGRNWH